MTTVHTGPRTSGTKAVALRRVVLLGTPAAFAALTLFHPHAHPAHLGDTVETWLLVHTGQLVLSVMLAYCLWFLLEGVRGTAAGVARATLPVFLVFFSATDAVAGLATGWLAASGQGSGSARMAEDAITRLFDDNWLTGNVSIAGSVGGVAWLVIAWSAAVALRGAGADRLTVGLMACSSLFFIHPPPTGTVGMLALLAAAYRWERLREQGRPGSV